MRRLWTLALVLLAVAVACTGVKPEMTCQKDSDCFAGYRCDASQTKICLRACSRTLTNGVVVTEGCLDPSVQYCNALAPTIPDQSEEGVCRDGAPDSDSGGGDPIGGDPNPGDH
jgi:hypothetical protein